jgi:hypothetical protein
VQALKARGYFTDNEAAYSRSVQSLASLALRSGFDALGAASNLDAGASPALPLPQALASAEARGSDGPAPTTIDPLDGGALLERTHQFAESPLAGLSVPRAAFADEVNRAALLMSALRIAEPRPRDT